MWQSTGDASFSELFRAYPGNHRAVVNPYLAGSTASGSGSSSSHGQGGSAGGGIGHGNQSSSSAVAGPSGSGGTGAVETVAPRMLHITPPEESGEGSSSLVASSASVAAPRLRRGGVRAPEVIVSRRRGAGSSGSGVGPVESAAPTEVTSVSGTEGHRPRDPVDALDEALGRFESEVLAPVEEGLLFAYPTPGSSAEGEHLT